MKHLCIYHANCADGLGAALAVKAIWDTEKVPTENREFVAAHYGDTPPDVTDKHVTIVDFSYPRETLLEIYDQADSLLVIDHHKTAKEALEGLDFCVFDMTQSGAMLAWKYYFHPSEEFEEKATGHKAPLLIQYVQDRDLWDWELPNSKEVSAGLQLLPMTLEAWEPYLKDDMIPELIANGRAVVAYQNKQVEKIANSTLPLVNINEYIVPCINTTTLISEIGNEISKGCAFAVMYFDTADKRIYSLRSQENATDVSVIAKQFGGGGHKNAAGFSIPKDQMLVNTFIEWNNEIETVTEMWEKDKGTYIPFDTTEYPDWIKHSICLQSETLSVSKHDYFTAGLK